jgi:hypothetical protein
MIINQLHQILNKMKQLIIFISLVSFPIINVFGQTVTDSPDRRIQNVDTLKTITMETTPEVVHPESDTIAFKNFKGDIKGYKNGNLLFYSKYKELFINEPQALHEIKVSNFDYQTGKVFAYIGGFTFGFCLGSAISGDKIDESWWWTLGTGAAIAGLGIIIYDSGKSHHIKAIKIYNSTHKNISSNESNSLKIGFTSSGLGIIYKF